MLEKESCVTLEARKTTRLSVKRHDDWRPYFTSHICVLSCCDFIILMKLMCENNRARHLTMERLLIQWRPKRQQHPTLWRLLKTNQWTSSVIKRTTQAHHRHHPISVAIIICIINIIIIILDIIRRLVQHLHRSNINRIHRIIWASPSVVIRDPSAFISLISQRRVI